MKILGFFFIVGLLIIAIGLAFGFSVIRMLLSAVFGARPNPNLRSAASNQQKTKQATKQPPPADVKKIFTRDEGEYVDFEEIKD